MFEFDAAGLFVTEMKKMVLFYRDVMGMKSNWDGEPYAELFSGNMRLIMYSRNDFEKMTSRTYDYPEKTNGTLELSFSLPRFADVDIEYERVVKAGAQPIFPPTDMEWGQRTSFVADPDGNLIEIGSFQKEVKGTDVSQRKILLTSAGFNTPKIGKLFLELVSKQPEDIKALFVPTAAINAPSIAVLHKCMNDLLNLGIPASNIRVFDLHQTLTINELSAFDAIYFTGGSPQYLLNRINETGFNKPLNEFVNNGGVYVGVSAGSMIAAGNMPNNLGYLNSTIEVHRQTGAPTGIFDNQSQTHFDLTDMQAILIRGNVYEIIE